MVWIGAFVLRVMHAFNEIHVLLSVSHVYTRALSYLMRIHVFTRSSVDDTVVWRIARLPKLVLFPEALRAVVVVVVI